MENKAINPGLVKRAAELSGIGSVLVFPDGDVYFAAECPVLFEPLKNKYQAHALMLALMENHKWGFKCIKPGHKVEKHWLAFNDDLFSDLNGEVLYDESFPLLLLKCVSAQTGINLYA